MRCIVFGVVHCVQVNPDSNSGNKTKEESKIRMRKAKRRNGYVPLCINNTPTSASPLLVISVSGMMMAPYISLWPLGSCINLSISAEMHVVRE